MFFRLKHLKLKKLYLEHIRVIFYFFMKDSFVYRLMNSRKNFSKEKAA